MCKSYVGVWLVASLLVSDPAFAQTSPSQPPSSNEGPAAAGLAANGPEFLEMRQPDQFRSTNLRGTRVYGANNENVGEINDVLISRSGQVAAVIIGVGGFLGIGEKDVAVPMSMLLFQPGAVEANSTKVSPTSQAADGQKEITTTPPSSATGAVARHDTGIPDRLILKMTKQQLQNAPAFRDSIGDRTPSPQDLSAPNPDPLLTRRP